MVVYQSKLDQLEGNISVQTIIRPMTKIESAEILKLQATSYLD